MVSIEFSIDELQLLKDQLDRAVLEGTISQAQWEIADLMNRSDPRVASETHRRNCVFRQKKLCQDLARRIVNAVARNDVARAEIEISQKLANDIFGGGKILD